MILAALISFSVSATQFNGRVAEEISVMSYNVENLFDTVHDEGKSDYPYLPIEMKQNEVVQAFCKRQQPAYRSECFNLDWSPSVLAEKMKRIANTIFQESSQGPDVLVVSEVENLSVLKTLNKEFLAQAGYKTVVLIEGLDSRGIDVGVLSRFSLSGTPKLEPIVYQDKVLKTRGILEVPLKLDNGVSLSVFAVHFPSQANPSGQRLAAINTLNKMMKDSKSSLKIAAGDFNITIEEDAEKGLYKDHLSALWSVSHLFGCTGCQGTYFYRGGWDFLDAILFSQTFDVESSHRSINATVNGIDINILDKGDFQLQNGKPVKFDAKKPVGVSDHLAIRAKFIVQ